MRSQRTAEAFKNHLKNHCHNTIGLPGISSNDVIKDIKKVEGPNLPSDLTKSTVILWKLPAII